MPMRHAHKMRQIIINIVTMMIVITMFCWCSWYEAHYVREATVIDVTDNIITVVDESEQSWQFKGNGFKVNDRVRLTMNTMHTDSNVLDDVIESAKIIR